MPATELSTVERQFHDCKVAGGLFPPYSDAKTAVGWGLLVIVGAFLLTQPYLVLTPFTHHKSSFYSFFLCFKRSPDEGTS